MSAEDRGRLGGPIRRSRLKSDRTKSNSMRVLCRISRENAMEFVERVMTIV